MAKNNIFSIYDNQNFTNEEKKTLKDAKVQAIAGNTDWDSVHNLFEETRAKYGYSGGKDGSEYIPISSTDTESFSVAPTEGYKSPYEKEKNELTSAIVNGSSFKYDPETDPLYKHYKDRYTDAGQKAMDDTLGKVSARTGGIASSYAGQAAQSTYNDYMKGVTDIIPTLEQNAYNRHQQKRSNKIQDLGIINDLDATEYGRYNDDVNRAMADRQFNYTVRENDLAKELAKKTEEYNKQYNEAVLKSEFGDLSGLKTLGVDTSQYEKEKNYEKQYNEALLKAEFGDLSGLKALGVDTSKYEASLIATPSQGSYSSSDSGGLSFSAAKEAAELGVFDDAVIQTLHKNGYTDNMIRQMYDWDGLRQYASSIYENIKKAMEAEGRTNLSDDEKELILSGLGSGDISETEGNILFEKFNLD